MASNISIEELAASFKKLNPSEKNKLKDLIGEKWFEAAREEELDLIRQLLDKSNEQIRRGEYKSSENILNESKKNYGMCKYFGLL